MGLKFPFVQKDSIPRLVSQELVVALTPLGKAKADSFSGEGPKFDILSTLNEGGPCSISELAQETNMSAVKVRHILKELVRSGYAKRVGESG